MLVTGAAGSGKTSLKYRLFGKELPTVRCSTALAEAAIRAISQEIVGTDLTGWFKVTPDELMAMLGGALKVGVPMEEKMLQSGTPEAAIHEQPTNVSTTEENKLSMMADHPLPRQLFTNNLQKILPLLLVTVSSLKETIILLLAVHCI